MDKIKALWSLFSQGKSVADPHKWATHQVTVTMLAGFVLAVVQFAKVMGYALPLDEDTATAIAGGVIAVANTVMSIMGSKHLGLPAGKLPAPEQAVPSVQPSVNVVEQAQAVQPVAVPTEVHGSIDEDTIARAKEWADRNNPLSPNFHSDA